MKNAVVFKKHLQESFQSKQRNIINLEKFLYLENTTNNDIKPTIKLTSPLKDITENVKTFLSEEKNRNLVRDSFGDKFKQERLHSVIHSYVSSKEFLDVYKNKINDLTLDELSTYLVKKIAGLGILESLRDKKTITDINIISWDNIWVDDIYKGEYKTDLSFDSYEDYVELVNKFAFASRKSYSHKQPSFNSAFPQMRVNIVGQDLSNKISTQLRVISKELRYDKDYILETGFANDELNALLELIYPMYSNLISGGTGTGKTEQLRYYAKFLLNKATIMIEDTPETYLDELYPDKPIKMWQNRDTTDDSQDTYGYEYHLRNAMRQNPTYIWLQESRDKESALILEAAETDHIVSTTLHATSAIDAVTRKITLCQKYKEYSDEFYGKRITKAFRFGIHVKRFGKVRRQNEVVEYLGYKNGEVIANRLFEFDETLNKHVLVGKLSEKTWNEILAFRVNLETEEQIKHFEENIKKIECLNPVTEKEMALA
jgi:pilus assembly protein CpaF